MLHLKTKANWKTGNIRSTPKNLDGNVKFFFKDLKVREPDSIVGLEYPTMVAKEEKHFLTFHVMDLNTMTKSKYPWNDPSGCEVKIKVTNSNFHQPGVNFINVLRTAFAPVNPESVKRYL